MFILKLLKHFAQLTEFMTGMDTRIGYPNEHLAEGTPEELASPTYSTGIGLVIEGFERYDFENRDTSNNEQQQEQTKPLHKNDKSFFQKIQDFFDNENEDLK